MKNISINLGGFFGNVTVTGAYLFTVPVEGGYRSFYDYDKALSFVIDTMTANGDAVLYRTEKWQIQGSKKAQVFRTVKFLKTNTDGTGKIVSKNIRIDGLTREDVFEAQRKAGMQVKKWW